jgi:hypothetical protein
MVKRGSLSDFRHQKPVADVQTAQVAPNESGSEKADTKALIVRLNPIAHKAVKQLALDLDTSVNQLMLDGLNLIFERNGKPPIG